MSFPLQSARKFVWALNRLSDEDATDIACDRVYATLERCMAERGLIARGERIEGADEIVAELEEGAEEIREQRESAEQESETMSKESKAAQGARTREAVLAAIKSGRRSRGEIAAEVGVSATTVDQAGKRLIDEGLVERGRRGTFVLVGETASPSESSKSAPATTASIAGPLKRLAAKHFARKPRLCVEPVASPLMPVVAPVPVRLEALMGMRVHVGGLVVEVPSIEQLEAIIARWGSK